MGSNYNYEVCIVGLGPAGIGAALTLSRSNLASHMLCLDSGNSINNRHCPILQNNICKKEKPCSMISGIGGASLLGGHKISIFPAGSEIGTIVGSIDIYDEKLTKALKILNIYLPLQKPNISNSDITAAKDIFEKDGFQFRYYDSYVCNQESLKYAYENILSQLHGADVTILPNSEIIQVAYEDNYFKLIVQQDSNTFIVTSKYLIIGVGRLGQNFLKSLNRKFNLGGEENHLEIGVRLEFPTEIYSDIDKYHNDLKLLYNDIRTFCVCKGGKLAPYYLNDMFILDGYYDPANKTNFTNLAIMLRLKPSEQNNQILDEVKKRVLQISDGKPVGQMLIDYLNLNIENKTLSTLSKNSISFWVNGEVSQCFPEPYSTRIKEGVHKFVSTNLSKDTWGKVNIFAPAIEYSWLKFTVKSDFSILPRMYLIGDCTGRFRGILQAFCSGIICAENIIGDAYEKDI